MTEPPVQEVERREPPFDPTSWYGALVVMLGVAAAVWIVQIVSAAGHYHLTRDAGLRPREVRGLWGIVASPFLHDSYYHMLSDTVPFVLIGWVILLAGVRSFVIVTAVVVVLGGLASWSTAPHGLVVGASGLIVGWLGYLLGRAYFARSLKWIVVAVLVLFFFGTLLGTLLPGVGNGVSWVVHVCYFVAGVVAAAVLHPRRRKARPHATPAVEPPVS